jgi:cytidine deaminase
MRSKFRAAATPRDAEIDALVTAARQVRQRAYAPYSKYKVGAAILTRTGNVYTGCNVENSSFGATICAERSAIVTMIAADDRDPVACVVATGGAEPGSPCGICRQVLAEFADDLRVVLVAGRARRETTLRALLPDAFLFDRR